MVRTEAELRERVIGQYRVLTNRSVQGVSLSLTFVHQPVREGKCNREDHERPEYLAIDVWGRDLGSDCESEINKERFVDDEPETLRLFILLTNTILYTTPSLALPVRSDG